MSQQLSKKEGYRDLVQYIGEEKSSQKLAKLNTLIRLKIIKLTPAIKYYKARLIEQGLAYFMTNRANEITNLGMMLGDVRKHIKGTK